MSYDSKCHDLAETFLDDVGVKDPKKIDALAQVIQDAIENYLEAVAPLDDSNEVT